MKIEEILKERVTRNSKVFSKDEIAIILENLNLFSKVYLLGNIDGKLG